MKQTDAVISIPRLTLREILGVGRSGSNLILASGCGDAKISFVLHKRTFESLRAASATLLDSHIRYLHSTGILPQHVLLLPPSSFSALTLHPPRSKHEG